MRVARFMSDPRSVLMKGGLALALLAFMVRPATVLSQEIIPPSESQEKLDVPSLEEELGSAAPWRQTPPGAATPTVPAEAVETEIERRSRTVSLNGLDKITGRIMSFEAPVDVPAQFGALQITARTCHKRPPEETPEVSAYLEIEDFRTAPAAGKGEPKRQVSGQHIFSGWMFASSPALSALEHPIYDVWVIDCKTSLPPQTSGSE